MELRDYLRVIATRRWIIVQAIAVVAVVALVGSLAQKPVYEAETEVFIRDQSGGPNIFGNQMLDFGFQPERKLSTQVEIVKLRPMAEQVIKRLNLQTTPDALLAAVQVDPVGQTDLMRIRVSDTDPRRATDIANGLAEAYVNWSRDSNQSSYRAAIDVVSGKLDDARKQLFGVAQQMTQREGGKKPVPEELKAQLQVGTGLFITLSQKLEELTINETLEQGLGQSVSPAAVPGTPVRPRPTLNTILGLIVGAVLGMGGALLAEYLDNTIKTDEDIERYYGAPALAHVPGHSAEPKGGKRAHNLIVAHEPNSAAAEAYRALRTSLDYLNFDGSVKKILVTSAGPREGKSTTIANLGASIAQTGKRVLIIGCDFRRPTTHLFFGLKNTVGLCDVLTGKVSLRSAIQDSGVPNLGILTSGANPPNPSELLGSAAMKSVLEHAASVADFVLIDSPPALAVTDSAVLAPLVDGILLVSEAGNSTREGAQRAVEVLSRSETRILGVVLNYSPKGTYGYGYGYGYGYEYGYGYDYYHAQETETGEEAEGRAQAAKTGHTAAAGTRTKRQAARRHRSGSLRGVAAGFFRALAVAGAVAVVAAIVVIMDLVLHLGLLKGIMGSLGLGIVAWIP